MTIRPADPADFDALVRIWHDGWHDAHAQLLPPRMVQVRTPDNFRQRVADAYQVFRVMGPVGAPLGFSVVRGNELYQFYVSEEARGTGVAAELLGDAEREIARSGGETAWLSCAIGNHRAARFYEKHGWIRTGTVVIEVDTPIGVIPLEVWHYEKDSVR